MPPTQTVHVAEGNLRGQRVESRAGGFYWSFKGIPYARPPVGPLRFKDAQPAKPWSGVRDAFAHGDVCRQVDDVNGGYVGSEDCLFLNVYVPDRVWPKQSPRTKKPSVTVPVMVFIHGGGFEFGSGDASMSGPDFLVADDVILVTFNYRVGVLGFLYLEEASPGNAGLKDQVAALRWVHKNIAAFGGDPNNVTLFGMSAGGASVHMHMLSPMSKGLFHRAIAMSGAAVNPWAIQTEPADTTRRLARLLGCTSDSNQAIVDFLRTVDCESLVTTAHEKAVPETDRKRLIKFSFVPTEKEMVVSGVKTFLPDPPEILMKKAKHHPVPYMTGIVEFEGLLALVGVDFREENIQKTIDGDWVGTILPELRLPKNSHKVKEALHKIREFYLGGKHLSDNTVNGFLNMISDISFNEGVDHALRCMANTSKASLYQYYFTFDDKLNFLKALKKLNLAGAAHADDLGYLFRIESNDPDLPADSLAAVARRRMVRLWTNFAKTGDPTPSDDDPLLDVRWLPYSHKQRHFLDIGTLLVPGKDLLAERFAFWHSFRHKYGGHTSTRGPSQVRSQVPL